MDLAKWLCDTGGAEVDAIDEVSAVCGVHGGRWMTAFALM